MRARDWFKGKVEKLKTKDSKVYAKYCEVFGEKVASRMFIGLFIFIIVKKIVLAVLGLLGVAWVVG